MGFSLPKLTVRYDTRVYKSLIIGEFVLYFHLGGIIPHYPLFISTVIFENQPLYSPKHTFGKNPSAVPSIPLYPLCQQHTSPRVTKACLKRYKLPLKYLHPHPNFDVKELRSYQVNQLSS